jgi:2-isopropylmalate synthase
VGSQIVLGKHSGRHAFAKQLADMGYTLSPDEIQRAFTRFKELADRKVELSDADLAAIVADEVYTAEEEEAYELVSLQVSGGTAGPPAATVRVRRVADDVVIDESATGDGMVDAACGAIRRALDALGPDAHGLGAATLVNFNVAAVTRGIDALGDVTVQVEVDDGQRFTGRGVSTDIVEASARAFVNALNKSVRLKGTRPSDVPITP